MPPRSDAKHRALLPYGDLRRMNRRNQTIEAICAVIALMKDLALPESSGPGVCETILDGARLSSNRKAAAAAEQFPALSAEVLQEITEKRSHR
jgi:hypothetical protein